MSWRWKGEEVRRCGVRNQERRLWLVLGGLCYWGDSDSRMPRKLGGLNLKMRSRKVPPPVPPAPPQPQLKSQARPLLLYRTVREQAASSRFMHVNNAEGGQNDDR